MRTTLAFTLAVALASVLAAGIPRTAEKPSCQSHRFIGLGDLPGGSSNSVALGVSGDGSLVVGHSLAGTGFVPFRWTQSSGMVRFQTVSRGADCYASAVSADGLVVAGFSVLRTGADAFRWTPESGLVSLGVLPGSDCCRETFGISADGSVIVGSADTNSREEAFRWTQDEGMVGLGSLPGRRSSFATGVSADGSVVVGWAYSLTRAESGEAFLWTQDGGMVGLGTLPGDVASRANGVSADGSVVVGWSGPELGQGEAFRWTKETRMVGLGVLPGGSRNSAATAVSADGSVIVGASHGPSGTEAFVWDSTHGMRSLRHLLISEAGLDRSLRGWKLRSANAVSRDGSVIVGFGINPKGNREAWIARIDNKPATDAPEFRVASRLRR